MKKAIWATPNKMLIKTGHKTFDRQTDVITHGNVFANTMIGLHIRPYCEVYNAVGKVRPPGHLQDYDLTTFRRLGTPSRIIKYVKDQAVTDPLWLYVFFHHNGSNMVIHGYVVTDKKHNLLKTFVTGPTYKSYCVINECVHYVAETGGES